MHGELSKCRCHPAPREGSSELSCLCVIVLIVCLAKLCFLLLLITVVSKQYFFIYVCDTQSERKPSK